MARMTLERGGRGREGTPSSRIRDEDGDNGDDEDDEDEDESDENGSMVIGDGAVAD